MESDQQRRCQGSFVLYWGSVFTLLASSHFLYTTTTQIHVFPPSPPPIQPLCPSHFTGWRRVQTAPNILTRSCSYKHQTIIMAGVRHPQSLRGNPPWAEVYMQVQHEQQIHPPPWPETKHSSANNLHGQRFLRRYNNLILTTTKHASSLLKTPHTPPNLLTPNLLSARRTTGSLQWSDSPPWDIVVHPFSFIFF